MENDELLLCIKDFINWEGNVTYEAGEFYYKSEIDFVTTMLHGRPEKKTFPKHFAKINKVRNKKINKILNDL